MLTSLNSVAQTKKTSKDSVLLITYTEKLNAPPIVHASLKKLIISKTSSYYFFINAEELVDNRELYPGIIKVKDSNYLLHNGPMYPKYNADTYWVDSLFPMKWKLLSKRIIFKGKEVREATTFFRGRFYTAYYDPNIPISDGPYKFGGLPGLIVKLYDEEHNWDFELESIENYKLPFKPKKIYIAGDFNAYKILWKEWDRRISEKAKSKEKLDPNCLNCISAEPKRYSIEKGLFD